MRFYDLWFVAYEHKTISRFTKTLKIVYERCSSKWVSCLISSVQYGKYPNVLKLFDNLPTSLTNILLLRRNQQVTKQ